MFSEAAITAFQSETVTQQCWTGLELWGAPFLLCFSPPLSSPPLSFPLVLGTAHRVFALSYTPASLLFL